MNLRVSFHNPVHQKILCVGVYDDMSFPAPTKRLDTQHKGLLTNSIENSKFKGKPNQALKVFTPNGDQILLIGLGKPETQNLLHWQKVGGSIADSLSGLGTVDGAVEICLDDKHDAEINAHMALGAILKSWRFEKYFTKKKPDELFSLKSIQFQCSDPKAAEKAFKAIESIAEGVSLTRSLITEPSNVINPETFSKIALGLKKDGLKVRVLGEKELKKLGMNLILGVGQGSVHESKLVVLEWNGASKKSQPVAFAGKGVTFDSGGLSLKPPAGMEEMKYDMSGGATVLGLMKTLALRKAKVNVVGVIGLVENMPSGSAQRPGDVVESMSGQTVEILNTDAEGRLVLGDVLWYTQSQFKPKFIVDLATLTGAIIITLGKERAGLFSSDKELSDQLSSAGEEVGELLWPFPLDEAYDRDIDSDIADMRNIGNSRGAGSITAATFLQRFTNGVPWAHLDIAGVAWNSKPLPLSAKGATGFGLRLLNDLVSKYYEEK